MKVMSKVHKRQDYIIAPTKSRSQTTPCPSTTTSLLSLCLQIYFSLC